MLCILTGLLNSLTPGAFYQKHIFWTFWRFSAWIWAKLAPIYSKWPLQHDSMPFFPLASGFTTFLLGHMQKSKFQDSFWTRKWPTCTSLGFFLFLIFSIFLAFPFSPFLIFLLQWLTFFWACFQFKNFWEGITETGNFYHGVQLSVATGNFALSFSLKFLSILVHISGSTRLITLICVSLQISFPPAELEYR